MTVFRGSVGVWWTAASAAVANAISWQVGAVMVVGLVAHGTFSLLGEWQRRKTFRELVAEAPTGTVVRQEDDLRGRSMTVTLGSGEPQLRAVVEDQG
ncbi:hypothetical protein ETD83_14065 [Actinomadura soli]|uniref:Uncharacterized protein n=1 Tax=Actinomadura soli TaxID=2508997 RepID=A0A5C4JDK9_9ACTN|nr:hypothetical protein [Actinomadura soli]TMR01754.1 hypothetical protein ETD83_14065 [Actinomadura soli]